MPTRPLPDRRLVLALCIALALPGVAGATPRWWISKPVEKGKETAVTPAPLQKEAAHDKELAERFPVYRINVEGVREFDTRPEPPRTAEERFADALNAGSPELVAGKSYDGYYYDGTLFWGSDPLSFAWKNVTHWLRR
ncbi:MAG TPA: hypothetical protein VLG08_02150 [Casimicrobiaceae bacterium]|nr:hypothetical protein [Casimicrobiaceae bacterium]